MAEHLRADSAQLHAGAAYVDGHAAELIAAHTEANERVAAAAAGLIGASAAALTALTAHWESESAAHFTDMLDHTEKLRTAAGRYTATDDAAAEHLDATAGDLGDQMGL